MRVVRGVQLAVCARDCGERSVAGWYPGMAPQGRGAFKMCAGRPAGRVCERGEAGDFSRVLLSKLCLVSCFVNCPTYCCNAKKNMKFVRVCVTLAAISWNVPN